MPFFLMAYRSAIHESTYIAYSLIQVQDAKWKLFESQNISNLFVINVLESTVFLDNIPRASRTKPISIPTGNGNSFDSLNGWGVIALMEHFKCHLHSAYTFRYASGPHKKFMFSVKMNYERKNQQKKELNPFKLNYYRCNSQKFWIWKGWKLDASVPLISISLWTPNRKGMMEYFTVVGIAWQIFIFNFSPLSLSFTYSLRGVESLRRFCILLQILWT